MPTELIETAGLAPQPPAPENLPPPTTAGILRRQYWIFVFALSCLLVFGAAARIYPSAGFRGRGYDEVLYRKYVGQLLQAGLMSYPDIVENYIEVQAKSPNTYLPPTRFLYIYCGSLWVRVFGTEPFAALRAVSCLFSILTLGLCAVWSWRLAGRAFCLAATALMACAPVEIHLAQHAMIDGFFAFWALLALWGLWESLRDPARLGWQMLMAGALAAMVLTKENAFFIYVGLLVLLALNYKLRFGTITSRTLLLFFTGPLAGTVILLFLGGGVENVVQVYRLLIGKAYTLQYAIVYCDGPWYRYLMDLLLTSPLVLLLAFGGAFHLRRADKAGFYLLAFVVGTYLVMCNLKYGLNLRYATVWDFSLRYLAVAQLTLWTRAAGKHARWVLAFAVAAMCAYDLRQYSIYFIHGKMYELVSYDLLRTINIIKD